MKKSYRISNTTQTKNLRRDELCQLLGIDKSALNSLMKVGFLPKPINTRNGPRWVRDDISREKLGLKPLGMIQGLQLMQEGNS